MFHYRETTPTYLSELRNTTIICTKTTASLSVTKFKEVHKNELSRQEASITKKFGAIQYIRICTIICGIKTHDSESRGQEAVIHDELVSYLYVAPL